MVKSSCASALFLKQALSLHRVWLFWKKRLRQLQKTNCTVFSSGKPWNSRLIFGRSAMKAIFSMKGTLITAMMPTLKRNNFEKCTQNVLTRHRKSPEAQCLCWFPDFQHLFQLFFFYCSPHSKPFKIKAFRWLSAEKFV